MNTGNQTQLVQWQKRMFWMMWITYAAFYLGRVNISVAMPGIAEEFGLTKTSLGGIFTLPFTIPASLAANWVIQTRMVAAMAYIGGFNIDDPPVRVSIALCLLGKKGQQALEGDYNEFQKLLRKDQIAKLSKQTIQMLNLVIANRLMKLAAQKGLSRLGKAIPIIGGALGGFLDYYSCKNSSEFAFEFFDLKSKNDIINY